MRALFPEFLINGKPVLVPDQDVEISRSDLEADDSGRDESGYLHRIVTRERMRTWTFSYDFLTKAEYEYLMGLFAGNPTFAFTYDGVNSCIAYCSEDSITWRNARTGEYRNLSLCIIEC